MLITFTTWHVFECAGWNKCRVALLDKHRSEHNTSERIKRERERDCIEYTFHRWMLWDKMLCQVNDPREREWERRIGEKGVNLSHPFHCQSRTCDYYPLCKLLTISLLLILFPSPSCSYVEAHLDAIAMQSCDCLRTTKTTTTKNLDKECMTRECIRGIGINCMNVFDIDAR